MDRIDAGELQLTNTYYPKAAARFMAFNAIFSDEEVDYTYSVLQGQGGVPSILIGQNLELIKDARPPGFIRS